MANAASGTPHLWLHFRDPTAIGDAAAWQDLEVPRVRALQNGSIRFECTSDALPGTLEFALRAGENWDNNRGQNYHLGPSDGPLLRVPVVLGAVHRYKGQVTGYAYVQNLALHKQVRLHLSEDGGATVRAIDASFKPSLSTGPSSVLLFPNVHGAEAWEFATSVRDSAQLRFLLEYRVRGERYVDDDSGCWYQTTPPA